MIMLNMQPQQPLRPPQKMNILLKSARVPKVQMMLHTPPPNRRKERLPFNLLIRWIHHFFLHTPPPRTRHIMILPILLDHLLQLLEIRRELLLLRGRVILRKVHRQQFRCWRSRLRKRRTRWVRGQVGVGDALDAVEQGHQFAAEGGVGVRGHELFVRVDAVPVDEEPEHGWGFFAGAPVGALGARLGEDVFQGFLPGLASGAGRIVDISCPV